MFKREDKILHIALVVDIESCVSNQTIWHFGIKARQIRQMLYGQVV